MMDATEAGEDTAAAAAEDDHSLSYQSVQEIRRAFESFWTDYATTVGAAASSDSDATGVDRLDELHQRYVQRYLAHVKVPLGDGQRPNEGSRTTDDGTLSDALPELDSDAEDDSEIDARISKVLRQQDQQHDQSSVGSRRDRPRKRTHSELSSSSHQRRRSANPPQQQKQQHPPPSATTATTTTTKAKALRQRPQIRPLTSGVLSSIVLVNSYDTPSTLRTLAAAKRKKQAALKRKRKGESDLDVDALWAAHWRMKSSASARKMNGKLKSSSANARPPYLRRALRRGKRCYKL
ncbi:hypothetical protein BZA70DRAFT_111090 [Myxozyma melibiosi]|uniref:Uncharacterized protein n=1 Tax=Myxozyma melibiosi TaxID=54550 RepID=A0ABR1FA08_9ASCO